ncbi:MAG: ankyrin repeat domain-containing protein [Flavobacterium sp.]|nr:ankyrin repeat domain-containing protein [Flavobacterium sp.]
MKKQFSIIIVFLVFVINAQTKNIFDIARSGTIKEMKSAFKKNPDCINELNSNKSSTLILASYRGNIEVAKFLINNIKNINYVSDMGTALMGATYKNQIDLVQLMIFKNADINLQDLNGNTALMLAVQTKNLSMVQLLSNNKADKTIKNKEGKTAFEFAVFSGDDNIINMLK